MTSEAYSNFSQIGAWRIPLLLATRTLCLVSIFCNFAKLHRPLFLGCFRLSSLNWCWWANLLWAGCICWCRCLHYSLFNYCSRFANVDFLGWSVHLVNLAFRNSHYMRYCILCRVNIAAFIWPLFTSRDNRMGYQYLFPFW